MLQTSSMSLYEDLTCRGGGLYEFWSVMWLFGEFRPPFRLNIFGAKRKGKDLRRPGLGIDTQNMCAKNHGLALKNGVDVYTFVRKMWVLRSSL